jgi:hypothetical protein
MHKKLVRSLLITIVCLIAAVPFSSITAAPDDTGLYTMQERFGIGHTGEFGYRINDYALDQLQVGETFPFGWWANWDTYYSPPNIKGMEFAQLIKVGASYFNLGGPSSEYWGTLQLVIQNNLGATWFIGNEPEEKRAQGNRTPQEYAQIYHLLYDFIKAEDETAQVVVGGVVQASTLRMKWLDAVLAYYQDTFEMPMPMDAWSIHEQILPEIDGLWGSEVPKGIVDDENEGLDLSFADNASVPLFIEQVTNFRRWMKRNGYQDKPLIISEYGVLLPSNLLGEDAGSEEEKIPLGDQMVKDYMIGTFDWLISATDAEIGMPADGHRLVQRWLWYSLNDQEYNGKRGFNGSLYIHNKPSELTQFGETLRDYAWGLYAEPVYLYLPLGLRNSE